MQYVSEITTQASGSAGGLTASHNQYVRYFRARTIPVDPLSPRQGARRFYFRLFAAAWTALLTDTQRAAWAVYAANVTLPNALGDSIYMTGRHHFFRTNLAVKQAWGPGVPHLDAPTVFSLSSFAPPTFTANTAAQRIYIAFDEDDGWHNEQHGYLLIYASRPQTQTINFWKGPYRHLANLQGDPDFPPIPPVTLTYPRPIATGERYFFRTIAVRADGRTTHSHRAQCDVTPTA